MTVLADFPENGIYLDTADEPSAVECRVALVVLSDEYERSWRIERVYEENDARTPAAIKEFSSIRKRYVEANERILGWMAKKNYSTKPYLY